MISAVIFCLNLEAIKAVGCTNKHFEEQVRQILANQQFIKEQLEQNLNINLSSKYSTKRVWRKIFNIISVMDLTAAIKVLVKKGDKEAATIDVIIWILRTQSKLGVSDLIYDGLKFASKHGYLEIVKLFIADLRNNNVKKNFLPFLEAIYASQIDVVKLFFEEHDYLWDYCYSQNIFLGVCASGSLELVKLFLDNPRVDPSVLDNSSLMIACHFEKMDILQLLLSDPRIRPGDYDNIAIRHAYIYGTKNSINLLLADPRG